MRQIKPSRQFAAQDQGDTSLDVMRHLGVPEAVLLELEVATSRAAERRAAWKAAGRPGLAEMEASVQRANDLAFAGMPGYARNAVLGIFEPEQPQNATPSKTR